MQWIVYFSSEEARAPLALARGPGVADRSLTTLAARNVARIMGNCVAVKGGRNFNLHLFSLPEGMRKMDITPLGTNESKVFVVYGVRYFIAL